MFQNLEEFCFVEDLCLSQMAMIPLEAIFTACRRGMGTVGSNAEFGDFLIMLATAHEVVVQ